MTKGDKGDGSFCHLFYFRDGKEDKRNVLFVMLKDDKKELSYLSCSTGECKEVTDRVFHESERSQIDY